MAGAQQVGGALGEPDDVVEVEPRMTRLPDEVRDASLVHEGVLERVGATGVLNRGGVLQVVVRPEADTVAGDLEEPLE